MRRWAHLFVFLLAAAYAVAGLPWLVAHGLLHHSPEGEAHAGKEQGAHCSEEAAMVAVLVHGHAHPDGVPEHEHGVSPPISFRNEPPDLQRPLDAGPFRGAALEALQRASFERDRSAFVVGAGPPSRPYALCVLLI